MAENERTVIGRRREVDLRRVGRQSEKEEDQRGQGGDLRNCLG